MPPDISIESRSLSRREFELADWLLRNSTLISEPEKENFRAQLGRAVVSSGCVCGCATIDFTVDGKKSGTGGLRPISEAAVGENEFGIFIHECEGLLSGMEIYALANLELPSEFPPISDMEIG